MIKFSAFLEWENYPSHLKILSDFGDKFFMTDFRLIRQKHIPKRLYHEFGDHCFDHKGITIWAIDNDQVDFFKSILPPNSMKEEIPLEEIIRFIE